MLCVWFLIAAICLKRNCVDRLKTSHAPFIRRSIFVNIDNIWGTESSSIVGELSALHLQIPLFFVIRSVLNGKEYISKAPHVGDFY